MCSLCLYIRNQQFVRVWTIAILYSCLSIQPVILENGESRCPVNCCHVRIAEDVFQPDRNVTVYLARSYIFQLSNKTDLPYVSRLHENTNIARFLTNEKLNSNTIYMRRNPVLVKIQINMNKNQLSNHFLHFMTTYTFSIYSINVFHFTFLFYLLLYHIPIDSIYTFYISF